MENLPVSAIATHFPISKFPSVRRDISIVVDQRITAAEVLGASRQAAGEHLRDLQLFDEYKGQGIDSDKKSLAIGLIFQGHSNTLTEVEIEDAMSRVLLKLSDDFGVTLRK